MKKTYLNPEADVINFMAEENIAVIPGTDSDKVRSGSDNTQTPDASEVFGGGVDGDMT